MSEAVTEARQQMLADLKAVVADSEELLKVTAGAADARAAAARARVEESLRAAIQHPRKDKVEIMLPGEVRDFVKGIKIITINNMADLILY